MNIITKRPDGSIRIRTRNTEPTKTKQAPAELTDINIIVKKYKRTGQVPVYEKLNGVYGDFSEIGDLQSAMQKIQIAKDAFMTIPSQIRLKFNNDPQELINYLSDPSNHEESIKLGLRNPKLNLETENPIPNTPQKTQKTPKTQNKPEPENSDS